LVGALSLSVFLLNDSIMGWQKKLLFFFLCLPLSNHPYPATLIEATIAVSSEEKQHRPQTLPAISLPAARPVSQDARPHANRLMPLRALPPATPSFNSQQFDQQLQRYLRFVAHVGQPDILIVGSSRALQGIDPIVLQQTLIRRGHPKLRIFNFGINGATAQVVDLLLRQILTPNQLPRFIVWGDGVRAFNSGRIDITYNRAIASPGYQLLTAGIRPTLPAETLPSVQHCAAFSRKPLTDTFMYPLQTFNVTLLFEPALKQPTQCWEALKILLLTPTKLEPLTIANLQEAMGFQTASEQFNPKQYFQRYPQIQGKYDADYREFTLDGSQTEALINVVKLAKTYQIPLIFVNLPLTQIYLDETRTVNEKQFHTYLQRFARSHGLTVYDLSQRWPNQTDYFTDPSHLNRYGAAAVAAELGKSLVIPERQP
jgi:hypothetical protein